MLTFITNKKNNNLKNLVFSALNMVLSYDCDGYKIPFANHYQQDKYIDLLMQSCIEVLLVMMEYKAPYYQVLKPLIDSNPITLGKIQAHFLRQQHLTNNNNDNNESCMTVTDP